MWLEFTVRVAQKQIIFGDKLMIQRKNNLDVGKIMIAENTRIPTKSRLNEVEQICHLSQVLLAARSGLRGPSPDFPSFSGPFAIQRTGRLNRPNGKLKLTMRANQAIQDDLLHILTALEQVA